MSVRSFFRVASVALMAPLSAHAVQFGNVNWDILTAGNPYNFNLSNGVARIEIRSGDRHITSGFSDPTTSERTEMAAPHYSKNDVIRMDFQFMVDAGPRITSKWFVFAQVHAGVSDSPPFAMELANETISVNHRSTQGGFKNAYNEPLKRNHWYTVRVEHYPDISGGSNGYLKVNIDGRQVVNYKGLLGYTNQAANKPRLGIYRFEANETVVLNFRNTTIRTGSRGTVFNDIAMPGSPSQPQQPQPPTQPTPSEPTPVPPASNLIPITLTNPGFEQSLSTGWINHGNAVITSDRASGRWAVSIGNQAGGIAQVITSKLVPGRKYRLSFTAKTGSTSDRSGVVGLIFTKGSQSTKEMKYITSTQFQRQSIDFVAPSGMNRIAVYSWKDAGPSVITVDDISLSQFP